MSKKESAPEGALTNSVKNGYLGLDQGATLTEPDDGNEAFINHITTLDTVIDDWPISERLAWGGFKLPSELGEPEPVQWLIEGVWPAGSYGMWGGAEKSFKSFLTTYCAICVAAGVPCFGHQVKQGTVAVFTGEGSASLFNRRMRRICKGLGVDPDTLPLLITDKRGNTKNPAFVDEVTAACEAASLVVVDPWYIYNGATDNAGNVFEQGAELNKLSQRAVQHGAALWLVHHFNKAANSGALSLADLTQAGGREWCDSWVLIGRRKGTDIIETVNGTRQDEAKSLGSFELLFEQDKVTFEKTNLLEKAIDIIRQQPGIYQTALRTALHVRKTFDCVELLAPAEGIYVIRSEPSAGRFCWQPKV